jgi:hypothetical protein
VCHSENMADDILDLHPDAEDALNRRAEGLLPRLSTEPPPEPLGRDTGWADGLPVRPARAVGPILVERPDLTGPNGSIGWLLENGGYLGLHGADYLALVEAVDAVHRTGNLRRALGSAFIKERLFEWLRETRVKSLSGAPFCQYLRQQAQSAVETVTAVVPIYGLIARCTFRLGRVTIRPMSEGMFRRWNEIIAARPASASDRAALLTEFEKFRREHQGKAAVTLSVTAEPARAREVAIEEADRTLAVLRMFDRAATQLDSVAACVRYGAQRQRSSRVFLLGKMPLPDIHTGFEPPLAMPWAISLSDLREFGVVGLAAYDAILRKDASTAWEADVLASIELYGQSMLSGAVADRLLYVFAALESVLLRDAREPLAQNIGDRLAFALEKDAGVRRALVQVVKDAYDARSRFVHHGQKVKDHALVASFLEAVWKFYVLVLPASLHHPTKLAFIDSIDAIKYS